MPGQDLSLLPQLGLSGQNGFGLSAYGRVLSPSLGHCTWDEHCLTCQEKPCQEHNMEHILLKFEPVSFSLLTALSTALLPGSLLFNG